MASPFAYPGPTTDLDAIAEGRLIPPPDAKQFGPIMENGEIIAYRETSWIDTVMINDITFGPPKKPLNNSKPGDVMGVLEVKCSVDPLSHTNNKGRRVRAQFYFNMTALGRDGDGHAGMTNRSFGAVYSLVKALGLDGEYAADPATLATDHRDELLGRRVLATVQQRFVEETKRYFDGIQSFASAE